MPESRKKINWFKMHARTLTIHGAILAGFILFLFVFSNPVFERIQKIEGAASLKEMVLPSDTNNILWYIDWLKVGNSAIEIEGFTFIEGLSTENNIIYLVLKSDKQTYVFDTLPRKRHDVTVVFPQWKLDLDDSGFIGILPKEKIGKGVYAIGIYIQKGDLKALEYTDRNITVSD